jgi:hypothetical protein
VEIGLNDRLALQSTSGSDLSKGKRYDQTLPYPNYPDNFTNLGGVLDFYQGDSEPLFTGLTKAAGIHCQRDVGTLVVGAVVGDLLRAGVRAGDRDDDLHGQVVAAIPDFPMKVTS